MKREGQLKLFPLAFTILRVMVGWHFLYEGISKLGMDNWSSSAYLMESKWLFSGFFHWIVSDSTALAIVDFINIWGLIFIGLGLFVGLFTRIASVSGIILLLLYYIANPPFVESSFPKQGHYFFIDVNLIEAGILAVIAFVRRDFMWSLDNYFGILVNNRKEKIFPQKENHDISAVTSESRRELIKSLASLPVLGFVFFGMAKKSGWLSFEEKNLNKVDATSSATLMSAKMRDMRELKEKVPKGRIKNVEISRIIPGGNLIAGFAHARDLIYVSTMIKNYFTDEKVIETLWLYEACGINTTIMRTDEQVLRILNKYWKRGGKIQWLAQTYPKGDDLTNVKLAIDNGAVGAFVMGNISDQLVFEKDLEGLAKPIEYIRSQGLITGTAGHAIQVPMACVENGIEVDFFMKTFHNDNYWSAQPAENRSEFMHNVTYDLKDHNQFHDNIWCASPASVSSFFKDCKIPWIAYKVLAAGAIDPVEGFKFAFENGADFICVGMFDFQVISNANIVTDTLKSGLIRERSWFA